MLQLQATSPRGGTITIECGNLERVTADAFVIALLRKAVLSHLAHYVTYGGKSLYGAATLAAHGLRAGATVVIVPRLRAGGVCSSKPRIGPGLESENGEDVQQMTEAPTNALVQQLTEATNISPRMLVAPGAGSIMQLDSKLSREELSGELKADGVVVGRMKAGAVQLDQSFRYSWQPASECIDSIHGGIVLTSVGKAKRGQGYRFVLQPEGRLLPQSHIHPIGGPSGVLIGVEHGQLKIEADNTREGQAVVIPPVEPRLVMRAPVHADQAWHQPGTSILVLHNESLVDASIDGYCSGSQHRLLCTDTSEVGFLTSTRSLTHIMHLCRDPTPKHPISPVRAHNIRTQIPPIVTPHALGIQARPQRLQPCGSQIISKCG